MAIPSPTDQIAERVERLLLRHAELQRTNAFFNQVPYVSDMRHWGMEDFCSLLGLRPAAKYDTTWERIAKAVRDHVPAERRLETFRQLATTLLLTYALRNADSVNDLRLQIKLNSERARSGDLSSGTEHFSIL